MKISPLVKNIIIGVIAVGLLILGYIFFSNSSSTDTALTSSSGEAGTTATTTQGEQDKLSQDFVTMLLGVKSIKLDDTIFSDPAFTSLRDSSILLVPDGTEGRPNPFAPIGFESGKGASSVLGLGQETGSGLVPTDTTNSTNGPAPLGGTNISSPNSPTTGPSISSNPKTSTSPSATSKTKTSTNTATKKN